jgi:hypothetical protein
MRVESVEIYSDENNTVIMRHPGRRFPGLLIQGDALYSLCVAADEMCNAVGKESVGFSEANKIRNRLWDSLNRYKATLDSHGVPLPFSH